VVAVAADGTCRDVVPEADGGLLAVLGMTVDAGSDALWVASAAAPFMIDPKPAEPGRTMISRIDLARGRVTASYPLAGPGLLNDVALARDGTLYATESRGGGIYRLPRGGSVLQPVLAPGTLESPNGIVVLAGGELLVADFDGLALVRDPAGDKPQVARLATPDQLYLGGVDGLMRSGSTVIAIQNLVGRTRVWKLAIDAGRARVTQATVLMRGHPDFLNPTTGVLVGDRLIFVADTKLQAAKPDGSISALPSGRRGHRVLELAIAPSR
jgi:glucose/arabinose dehydrogenase